MSNRLHSRFSCVLSALIFAFFAILTDIICYKIAKPTRQNMENFSKNFRSIILKTNCETMFTIVLFWHYGIFLLLWSIAGSFLLVPFFWFSKRRRYKSMLHVGTLKLLYFPTARFLSSVPVHKKRQTVLLYPSPFLFPGMPCLTACIRSCSVACVVVSRPPSPPPTRREVFGILITPGRRRARINNHPIRFCV